MRQFKWRIFITYLVVILAIFLAGQLYLVSFFKNALTKHLTSNLESQARFAEIFLAKTIKDDTGSELGSVIKQAGRILGSRITVIDLEGEVIADSDLSKIKEVEGHESRPEFETALKLGSGTSLRYSPTLKKDMLYVAVLFRADGIPRYIIRLAKDLQWVESTVSAVKGYFAVASGIGLLVALILNFGVAHGLAGPVSEMITAAQRMARGNFDYKIHRIPQGELGTLAHALNSLSNQLKNKISEIAAEKAKNDAILKGMADGIMAVDSSGKIFLVNHTLRDWLTFEEMAVGRMPVEVIRSNQLQEVFSAVLRTGISQKFELPIAYPKDRTLEVNIVPLLFDGGGNGAIAVFHDVTGIKRLDQVRRDFVANVSHELKNPLTAIKGYAETLIEEGLGDSQTASIFIHRIHENAERMADLIQDVLALARLEALGTKTVREPVSLRDLIKNCLSVISAQAQSKQIIFQIEMSENDIRIEGDFEKLSQAVINLIDNAVKYSPEGSKITIHAAENEKEVHLYIKDQGKGIPKADLERIFERFYRVDKGRARDAGGTGLGLSIVKHAVMAHGGQVWAESELDQGSTFHITLPKN